MKGELKMIMTIKDFINKVIEMGGNLDEYITIINVNDKTLEYFPIDFKIEDDEIKIIIDC